MRTWILLLLCVFFTWSSACENSFGCGFYDQCCRGTCIDHEATCISAGAIAGIVISCLIIGGIVISICLCFCCACGPFQNRSQGAVIRYGGQTATTTTGTSYPTTNVPTAYGTSYPQPAPPNYSVPASYASVVQGQPQYTGTVYPPPMAPPSVYTPPTVPPPSYDETNVPPAYSK